MFDRANAHNVHKFLQIYILLHGTNRSIDLIELIRKLDSNTKAFGSQTYINQIETSIRDNEATGSREKIIEAIKNTCNKTAAHRYVNLTGYINSIILSITIS